jgi:small subunit ribosomal protein S4
MGEKLFLKGEKCLSDKCVFPKRMEREGGKGGPGQRRGRRGRKLSAYSIQLREKQKVKSIYGVGETQFHNYFRRAEKKPNTGEALLNMLETRLDNVIYRLGFAGTRPQARQLVRHGHVLVAGRRATVPSYCVGAGDVITLKDDKGRKQVQTALANREPTIAGWLELDRDNLRGTVVRTPGADDIKDMTANIQLIVELYSK